MPAVVVVPAPDGKTGNYSLSDYAVDLQAYNAASGQDAIRLRNKMVYSIAAEIDYAFYDYETKLFLNEGRFHVGSDFLQLGLAAASTVSNGARGKTILSALLGGVTGMNLSIDKNFFRQQTVQAIASSMEANRDQTKTTILKQLSQDTTAYPFAAARADLIRYFFAGTLSAGLQKLGQTAATNAQAEKDNLTDVQVASFSVADVQCGAAVSQAIATAAKSDDLTTVIAFLRAMNVTIPDGASADQVLNAIRPLGRKAQDDTALRKQYCSEAQRAGLIK